MTDQLDKLKQENEELKLKLEEEIMVKKSEVLMNRDLKIHNEKLNSRLLTICDLLKSPLPTAKLQKNVAVKALLALGIKG